MLGRNATGVPIFVRRQRRRRRFRKPPSPPNVSPPPIDTNFDDPVVQAWVETMSPVDGELNNEVANSRMQEQSVVHTDNNEER